MDGIFISYRRQDAKSFAGRLYDRLVAHFGDDRVFIDVEQIEVGVDFVQAIEQAVGSCRVLIVVIGDGWLDSRDEAGRRRLDDPEDFVRIEIKTALARDIRVVPVLEDGAKMPRAEDLPEDLRSLVRRQAITVHHSQWDGSTATLIHALQRLLGEGGRGGSTQESTPRSRRPLWAVAATVSALAVGGASWWWTRGQPPAAPVPPGTLLAEGPGAAPPPAAARPAPAVAERTPAPAPAVAAAPAPAPAPARAPVPAPAPAAAPAPRAVSPSPPPARPPVAPAPSPRPAPAPAPAAAPAAPDTPARAAPAPAVASAPAPAPAPPPASAPAAADERLPQAGQSWTYRVRGKWPTSPNRSVVITVSEVRDGLVVDRLSDPGADAPVLRRSRAGQGGFVSWPGIGFEFSPYLSSRDLTGWRSRGFTTPDVDSQWTQWHSSGQTIGREAVVVPAGRFDAHKVEVWSSREANGGPVSVNIEPVRIQYLVWYAPEVRRYVRMQRRVISASGQEMERDLFELVARRGG